MKNTITCLIPFYNEGNRILETLGVLTKSKYLSKMICVDDGSTDQSAGLIKKQFPYIKVIQLSKNQGKASAVREGSKFISTEYVLLFDADLSNIKLEEIDNALEKISTDKDIDMIILRRIVERLLLTLIRHDVVMSGQRVLKTSDLLFALKSNPKGYALETAINKYMIDNHKLVYWMPIATKNPSQHKKWGWKNALAIDSLKGYFSSVGFSGYLKQVLTFCRSKAI